VQPKNIVIDENGFLLRIEWSDGMQAELTAASLRDLCQSAKSKRLILQGLSVPAGGSLRIEDASLIGRYGINIVFSDGHDRGIYPWVLLREHALANSADKEISQSAINCGNKQFDNATPRPNDFIRTANGD